MTATDPSDHAVPLELLRQPAELLRTLPGPVLGVRLGDHHLAVASNEPRQLDYLKALFVPENSVWSTLPAAPRTQRTAVGLRLPQPHLHDLLAQVRARAENATPVRLHVHAPATQYTLGGGVKATYSESTNPTEGPVLVVHSPRGLVCVSTDQPYGHLNFARQLREYGYRRAEDDHWVGMHASCAQLPDGTGVLVVGRSGAGKSTTALALAAMDQRSGFVANDRVLLRAEPTGTLRALAMPVPIRLNAGTVHALGLAQAVHWDLMRPQPDYRTSDWARFGGGSKLSVLPQEWHQRTGTRLVDEVRLGLVLLPHARPAAGAVEVRPADHDHAKQTLTEQCMLPDDETFVEDWLGLRHRDRPTLQTTAEQTLDRLLALPKLTVGFGTGTDLRELAHAVANATEPSPPGR